MQSTYPYNINYNISIVYVYNDNIDDNNINNDNNITTPVTDNGTIEMGLNDLTDGYIDQNGNVINNEDDSVQTKQYAIEYDIENQVNDYNTEGKVSVIGLINDKIENELDVEDTVKEYATVVNSISKSNRLGNIENTHTESLYDFNTPGAICGKNWFVSEKLYNSWFKDVLNNSTIPEDKHYLYYIADSNIIKDINKMSYDVLYIKDIKHFWKLNIIESKKSKNKFTDEELSNFSQTFFKLLNQYTNYKYEPVLSGRIVSVYNKLINYYINNKYDDSMSAIDLMLNTSINTTVSQFNNTSSSCGCSTNSSSTNNLDNSTTIQSCYDIYKNSFNTLTVEMFGDITNFYNNYFYDVRTDDNGKDCLYSNEELCDILLLYIDEYLATYPNIDTVTNTSNKVISDKLYCSCGNNENSIKSVCDYNVIVDFQKLLRMIKYTSIDGNENKIQYWGKKFGELISKL